MLNGASPRSPTMSWLPAASDFRGDLRAALDQTKPTDRLEGLAALAGHRLGFLETVQLDRALARLDVKEASGFQTVRLAILSSSTVDHLPPAIRVAGLRRRLLIEVHNGSYGQYRQDLLDSDSALHRFKPQAALFSLSAREAIAGVPLTAAAAEVDAAIGRLIGELRSLWRKAREIGAAVIQQTFLDVSEPLFGGYERLVPGAPARSCRAAQRSSRRGRGRRQGASSSMSRAPASGMGLTPGSTSGAGFRASSKSLPRPRRLMAISPRASSPRSGACRRNVWCSISTIRCGAA